MNFLLRKRVFVPAMVSSYILYRPKYVWAANQQDKEPFPKYFLDKLSDLNERDTKYAHELMRENLINHYPNRYKYIVENLQNDDIISELDYIRVLYNRPLTCDRKINLRNKISKLIKEHSFTEQELELFEYLLKYYDCID